MTSMRNAPRNHQGSWTGVQKIAADSNQCARAQGRIPSCRNCGAIFVRTEEHRSADATRVDMCLTSQSRLTEKHGGRGNKMRVLLVHIGCCRWTFEQLFDEHVRGCGLSVSNRSAYAETKKTLARGMVNSTKFETKFDLVRRRRTGPQPMRNASHNLPTIVPDRETALGLAARSLRAFEPGRPTLPAARALAAVVERIQGLFRARSS
ncbi:hypothetical protein FA95DRAFT_425833 [Auriscalpium vulgare]|uniref:Uncharacterized protein n=1 Tax=Auriscalpium vulgare TaxID=40419 RepID=A0ACB8RGV3_9AGAM|nr:hypothetical protein FA95DRAFT_425833 [Auriscalpium vulgare]